MSAGSHFREQLSEAMAGAGGALAAADGLCRACVDLLGVDGAAISLIQRGRSRGTFGSSNDLSRRLDAYQFTYGEGPCLDAVLLAAPVLAPDLGAAAERRWPAFTASVEQAGIRAVFAMPVAVASTRIGALDLFRRTPGPLSPEDLGGALVAAHLAAVPLLDLMDRVTERAVTGEDDGNQDGAWDELESLERVEIYQATGFLIAQGGLGSDEALVRLRARAYASAQTASEVARDIVERRLSLRADGSWRDHRDSSTPGSAPSEPPPDPSPASGHDDDVHGGQNRLDEV